MMEAPQVEWDSEMNSPTAITYPDLPSSVIPDPVWAKEKLRTRSSSSLSRVTRRRTSRSPSLKGRIAPFQSEGLQQNILQEFFLTSRKRFVRIAYRILGNKEDAEDSVQDAFVSACRHFCKFEGRCALTTWLTRIVMNAALMALRKRKNTHRSFYEMDAAMSSFVESVPDTQPNPELACSRTESYEFLEVHLNKLNPLLREAVVTTYYDELSVTQASSAIGVSLGTYKARLFRGRRLLQQRAISGARVNSRQTKQANPATSR
jgi:RNA polymerase sigma-70 factor (ECF subfamily)